MLPVSHSFGLAQLGDVGHHLSMRLWPIGPRQTVHIRWRHSSHILTRFCYDFVAIQCRISLHLWQSCCRTCYAVHAQTIWATDCEELSWYPQCQLSGEWIRVCFGQVFGATNPAYHEMAIAVEPLQVRSHVLSIAEQTQTVYILPHTLGESCLVVRNRGSQENVSR